MHLRLALLASLVLVAACDQEESFVGNFDLPTGPAVLDPEQGGPFEEPIGFIPSAHTGLIELLALKQGRFLTTGNQASFVKAAPIATGEGRIISSVAAWAQGPDRVDVYGGDRRYGHLFRVPWVTGLGEDGFPIIATAGYTLPAFEDLDGSGDSPTLEIGLRQGFVAAERWTVECRGAYWTLEGTRSGIQRGRMYEQAAFDTRVGGVSLVVRGTCTEGDRFTFRTDNGLEEIDVGGTPLELAMSPQQDRLAMIVHDTSDDAPRLRWLEPESGSALPDSVLGDGALPARMEWMADGSALYVADRGRSSVWEIAVGAFGDLVEREIPLPWPTLDVAPLVSETGGRQLYISSAEGKTVWVLDLDSGDLIDVNLSTPELDGMLFSSPVTGIAAIPVPYRWPETDNDGVARWGTSVAVSLEAGKVLFMEEGTGCLVQDELGPRTQVLSQSISSADFSTNFGTSAGASFLEVTSDPSHHVNVSRCGGIAQEETWKLIFDRNLQGWVATGSVSGEQQNIVYEDQRYLSDDGSISLVIRAGTSPSEDGWTMQFNVRDGVLTANGDNEPRDNDRDVPFDYPGDPVFFHYRVGPYDNGWRPIDDRPFVLVPAEGGNLVGRVKPQNADVEISWD